jgi:hypothetical protein
MQKERGPGRLPMSAEQARRQGAVEVAKPTQFGITRKSDLRRVLWPRGSSFAFTVFDDPDAQSFETTRLVYSFLADLGFRTTIGVWPLDIRRKPNSDGGTCGNAEYPAFLQHLQGIGFKIGFHNAAPHSTSREGTLEGVCVFWKASSSDGEPL